MIKLEVLFMDPAKNFLDALEDKIRKKVLFNIWKSKKTNDPGLFKKINKDIWEFRTRYQTTQIRFLAFWDKRDKTSTMIIVTHGFVKKRQKIHIREIKKAEQLMKSYLKDN